MGGGCPHSRAAYRLDRPERWALACPDCRLSGSGRSAEEARVSYLLARREAGEALARAEEAAIAYSPWGTAAGCRR